jgi:hypothetical protein
MQFDELLHPVRSAAMPTPNKPAIDPTSPEDAEHGEASARLFQQIEDDPLRDESAINDPSPEATRS